MVPEPGKSKTKVLADPMSGESLLSGSRVSSHRILTGQEQRDGEQVLMCLLMRALIPSTRTPSS